MIHEAFKVISNKNLKLRGQFSSQLVTSCDMGTGGILDKNREIA